MQTICEIGIQSLLQMLQDHEGDMMTNKPPYTITEKAADYLAKIVETVTRLEFRTGFKRDIRLHRENRMRTIHSSLAIEGNSLSLDTEKCDCTL